MRHALVMLLAAALFAVPAGAFDSVPPGSSVHDGITSDAARSLEFPPAGAAALAQAARRPDFDEGAVTLAANGSVLLTVNGHYAPSHHCDRVPPATDAQAFAATTAYVDQQRAGAIQLARDGNADEAVLAIGRGLHALQDCFAHSNIADLGPAAEHAYIWSVSRRGQATPDLRMTGFAPSTTVPEAPPGDAYPYVHYNLDAPNATAQARMVLADGGTKFEHARQDAIAASRIYLQSVLGNLTGPQQGTLRAAREQAPAHRLPIPGLAVLPIAGCALAVARVRRRAGP